MTGHRTAQTSGRRPSALTNQIWFPAEDWLPPTIACEKEHLETQIMLCVKYDFVIIADYFCTNTFWHENQSWVKLLKNFPRIGRGLNGGATNFNRRIFSWRPEQPLLFRSFLQKFICVDLAILTRCIHTRYACFISLQMVIKIQYFVTLHRSQVGIMKNPIG